MKIGFIGQGYIGKNYADDFEKRGFDIVRYARSNGHEKNGDKLKDCRIIFIAVPTPTTKDGFDDSIVRSVVEHTPVGASVVIKSTITVGTSESIQEQFPDRFIFHSPEFLSEATAAIDAAQPERNIIGIPIDNDEYRARAKEILEVLPNAPYELVCNSREAELIKYAGNNWFFFKVMFINMLYDLVDSQGCDYDVIKEAMAADVRIGSSHLNPKHKSGSPDSGRVLGFNDFHLEPKHKSGRGAGGHCFIKDFEAFTEMYTDMVGDEEGRAVLKALRNKNIKLMMDSNKDLDLLEGVYGNLDDLGLSK